MTLSCLNSVFAAKLTNTPENIDPSSTQAKHTTDRQKLPITDRQSFPTHQNQMDRQCLTICHGQKNNWDPTEPPAHPRYRSHIADYDLKPEGLIDVCDFSQRDSYTP